MAQLPQRIGCSLPLLIVGSGERTEECDEVMNSLTADQFEVECKKTQELVVLAAKNEVVLPKSLHIHPILCRTISDLTELSGILREDEYHLYAKCFMTLVFIDVAIVSDARQMREWVLEFPGISRDAVLFVIYNAGESSIDLHSDNTCLCFKMLAGMAATSCIKEFLATTAAIAIERMLGLAMDTELRASEDRLMKFRCDFAAISCDVSQALTRLHKVVKEYETHETVWLGAYFEIMGMLEPRRPANSKVVKVGNPILPSFEFIQSVKVEKLARDVACYLRAAGYYHKVDEYLKCVDCGVRIIGCGCYEFIHPVAHYVISHADEDGMIMKAWDVILMVQRQGRRRQAALLASQFADAVNDLEVEVEMRIFSLDILLENASASGFFQLRDCAMPMFTSLLSGLTRIPTQVMAAFIAKIIGTIGPKLPQSEQLGLFEELNDVNALEINLPLRITDVSIKNLPYSLVAIDQDAEARRESVFIYSYIERKKQQVGDTISVAIAQTVTLQIEIYNPFAVALDAKEVRLVATDEAVKMEVLSQNLQPLKSTVLHCQLMPMSLTSFSITDIAMRFCGAQQLMRLPKAVEMNVIDNIPKYHLRTDLPLTSELSLYDGELYEFYIWVTNNGQTPISSLSINFQQPEIVKLLEVPSLPLLPSCQIILKCRIVVDRCEDLLAMWVVTSCIGSDYCCSHKLEQRLNVSPSLSVRRVFLLKMAQPVYDTATSDDCVVNQIDQICVGYEVENLSDCTFHYDANVSETKMRGLVGRGESILVTAIYEAAELQSDGSDADKSRVIALTKLMEEKLRERLQPEQRLKAQKCAAIMQRLEAKWNFSWAVSSTRKGRLVRQAPMIEDNLFQGIESRQVVGHVSWLCAGQEVTSLNTNTIYEMRVDFDKDVINDCELILLNTCARDRGSILWEGELRQKNDEGQSVYRFILCFGAPGLHMFKAAHTTSNGMFGHTSVNVRVVEA